ncbi:MAG: hypothetical protein ACPHO8_11000 [Mariniblastus sp.]
MKNENTLLLKLTIPTPKSSQLALNQKSEAFPIGYSLMDMTLRQANRFFFRSTAV